MKLLLHVCCAPCSVYCIKKLREEGIEPTLFWYNPNIHPFKEYEARRDTLTEYSKRIKAELIVEDEYGLDEFCKNVSGSIKTRCVDYCYPVRMRKTFEYAKQNGFDAVSTTLLYSIYQNHGFIKKLGENLSKEFGIDFLYRDFRYGFWDGHDEAVFEGLYMQKYCGCIFSEESRYLDKETQEPSLPEGFDTKRKSRFGVSKQFFDGDAAIFELLFDGNEVARARLGCEGDTVWIAKMSVYKQRSVLFEKLIKYIADEYRKKCSKIAVLVPEDRIPDYVKLGFDICEKEKHGIYCLSRKI